jgi:LacI family transcriptional regulator, galactose operon repressor
MVPEGRDDSYLIRERRAGTRLVFLDREPRHTDAVSGNRQGAISAVNHQLEAGHHPLIAFLEDRLSIFLAAKRYAGYLRGSKIPRVS